MRLMLIALDKRNLYIRKSSFDIDKKLATIRGRRWFRKGTPEVYEIDTDHIKTLWKRKKGYAYCMVDMSNHKSIEVSSYKDYDQKNINRLNYLTQESFWLARLKRLKMPLRDVLVLLLAGAGLWHFIRLFLLVLGFEV